MPKLTCNGDRRVNLYFSPEEIDRLGLERNVRYALKWDERPGSSASGTPGVRLEKADTKHRSTGVIKLAPYVVKGGGLGGVLTCVLTVDMPVRPARPIYRNDALEAPAERGADDSVYVIANGLEYAGTAVRLAPPKPVERAAAAAAISLDLEELRRARDVINRAARHGNVALSVRDNLLFISVTSAFEL